jgi:hypothetical protein
LAPDPPIGVSPVVTKLGVVRAAGWLPMVAVRD